MAAISRMSLTSCCRYEPAIRICSRLSLTFCRSLTELLAISRKPMIAFSGVRISCAIRDRKSDFAWLARSASFAALIQLRSLLFWSLIRRVTYRILVTSPSLLRRLTIKRARCQLPSLARYSMARVSSCRNRMERVLRSKNLSTCG